MALDQFNIPGLSNDEVLASRTQHGTNSIDLKQENQFLRILKSIYQEPMVILLLVTASLYFITGNTGDGLFLSAAILFVAAISFYQDYRSRDALEALTKSGQPRCAVIRNGETHKINIEDVVIGDNVIIDEGSVIPADGIIVHSNDFSINESVLTGESLAVFKDKTPPNNTIYRGTMVVGGLAIMQVTAIGLQTKWGAIGSSLEGIADQKTALEIQINAFVKKMIYIGTIVFAIVWGINYVQTWDIIDSLLKALTLAMSILPEEIPVAFTTFMALGAWRLMKVGIITKAINTVESLGSTTVMCIDKTGTITKNEMAFDRLYALKTDVISNTRNVLDDCEKELITIAMWASEPIPFDPMEIALHDAYEKILDKDDRPQYHMIHEYPLDGRPPMMTHVFANSKTGHRIIAAKGAAEALMAVSHLNNSEKERIQHAISELGSQGYRVLGVGICPMTGDTFPERQQDLNFEFLGLVAFYDPPKENINQVLKEFDQAGIDVKIITGDYANTTLAIAKEIDFHDLANHINGDELMQLDDDQLAAIVHKTSIYTRMFPEAKLRVINTLKHLNEIVAMTGDGVNDAPALKSAHIGIAMGQKGTEIAKSAATLILSDDNLHKMIDAVAMGRKIYVNLKKAIQYIISIHIPIILTVFIPLVLGWMYPAILSPVHVILLELIMGPTCSIIYENEPMEPLTMEQPPRPHTSNFFSWGEISTSILQGVMITAGVLLVYQYAIQSDLSETQTRAMVFTTLISSNIFLTLVNRSFYYSLWTTLQYRNNLVPIIIGITLAIIAALLLIDPLTEFFEFKRLNLLQFGISTAAGFVFVVWYELVKWVERRKT